MAFGSSKELLAAKEEIITGLRETIIDLKAQREKLQKRLDVLQEALIATRSLEAYQELKNDQRMEGDVDRTPDPDKVKRRQIEENWMNNLESPLFTSADEMIDVLTRGQTPVNKSVHDNAES